MTVAVGIELGSQFNSPVSQPFVLVSDRAMGLCSLGIVEPSVSVVVIRFNEVGGVGWRWFHAWVGAHTPAEFPPLVRCQEIEELTESASGGLATRGDQVGLPLHQVTDGVRVHLGRIQLRGDRPLDFMKLLANQGVFCSKSRPQLIQPLLLLRIEVHFGDQAGDVGPWRSLCPLPHRADDEEDVEDQRERQQHTDYCLTPHWTVP